MERWRHAFLTRIIKHIVRYVTFALHVTVFRQKIEKHKNRRSTRRVLVHINSGIGDSLFALPMIHELDVKGYDVYALVNKSTEAIARLCPDIKSYFIVNKYGVRNILELFKIVFTLNKLKFYYSVGALPSNKVSNIFFPIVLKIPVRIKHLSPHEEAYRNYDFLFNKLVEIDRNKHNVESNLMLLPMIDSNFKIKGGEFKINLPDHTLKDVKERLKKMGYSEKKIAVGIHPGCKETWAFKRWPAQRFADLINQLGKRENIQIVLFGGPDEINLADNIIRETTIIPLNLVGKLNIEETICAINFCRMFISNDSGLMHLATVFGVPVIGLYGDSRDKNEILTGPYYGSKNILIKNGAVEDIPVSEVYEKATELLNEIRSGFINAEFLN